ncbi:MAG: U32 family peptidase [Prevotella sp.]|nr:U32 family peptidase [Prevotella sp.]
MIQLELLAPAKDLSCGIAAIDHGADAVYIGAQHFGARVAAGNSLEDIQELCRYAHQYGARVYVTVNTLVYDSEMDEVAQLLHQLALIPVDAVLIQDMRLLSLVKDLPLVIHASTQADNRTSEKVEWLYHHGIQRAVLARELGIDDISAIHQHNPDMELEVFVHGALCVSYSGLCYASERCFNRSANRGACAQFCRMKFDLLDANGTMLEEQRHLLSLKDLNLSAHLDKLIEAGATSFKIEGRLKDISYVKNVTAAYSQLLDNYIARHRDKYVRLSHGRCSYGFQSDLARTFNRGYTTYFLRGRQPQMASFDTPKAIGMYVGKVKEIRRNSFTIAGTAAFVNGDGLCFFDSGRNLCGFRVNRVENNRLYPQLMPQSLKVGMSLYRSNDQAMDRMLKHASAERKIPVSMSLRAVEGGVALRMNDVEVTMPIEHQEARTSQRQNIVSQLQKLGGTPYECTSVDIPSSFNLFVPSSLLAALRRMAVEQLEHVQQRQMPARRIVDDDVPRLEVPLPIMQCRYCLRHELGFCVRYGGKKPVWREPLFLRLADGKRFRLEFDCSQCQMNVYEDVR